MSVDLSDVVLLADGRPKCTHKRFRIHWFEPHDVTDRDIFAWCDVCDRPLAAEWRELPDA